jgi:hypothetical protein
MENGNEKNIFIKVVLIFLLILVYGCDEELGHGSVQLTIINEDTDSISVCFLQVLFPRNCKYFSPPRVGNFHYNFL